MSVVNQLVKRHGEWVKIVHSFGATDTAEDIVQDMYVEVMRMEGDDRTVNTSYVWILLRRLYIEPIRLKARREKRLGKVVSYGEGFEFIDQQAEYHDERAMNEIHLKIQEEMNAWHWYDRELFKFYMIGDNSMRDINTKTNISLTSVFNTLTNCKSKLRKAVGEDYQDYLNQDFELI